MQPTVTDDDAPGRWRTLFVLAAAELLGTSLWFAASAVAPQLATVWELSSAQSGWLTAIVQLGFVAGTLCAAVLNLADIVSSRTYFAASALLAAVVNAALLVASGYEAALAFRFFSGFFMAGVYPPAMKMISTWFRARRGLAIGTLVGALTVGKAMPFLVGALVRADVRIVVWLTSAGAMAAAVLVGVWYRDGPYPFERRPFSWGLAATVFRQRQWRLALGGYLGHMWELYSYWTWIAAFLAASAAARMNAGADAPSPSAVGILGFGAIAVGGVASVWGGWIADRIGYERLVIRALALSGSCALAIGFAFGSSFWLLTPLAWLWGMAVIADSAQFSTLVTRSVPPHAVGTALTLQTSLGFLLTMVTIQLVPTLVEHIGWRWAFAVLAIGPALGIPAIKRLQRLRQGAAQAAAAVTSP
ncbi:MAG: MFS transporter [Gemmatimonadaceae bacterium]